MIDWSYKNKWFRWEFPVDYVIEQVLAANCFMSETANNSKKNDYRDYALELGDATNETDFKFEFKNGFYRFKICY